jgi:AbrB family looped-hinge helix DNA binding protein
MKTTVTNSNQVTIPDEIAREFRISSGTELDWQKGADGMILVKPLPSRGELARALMGSGRRWLEPGRDPISDLLREREQDDLMDQTDGNQ